MKADVSVLVMSCDSYEDCWKPFFTLKEKYWQDCPYKTYICTETKDCKYATTLKHIGAWTKRIRESLKEIDTKYIILMLEDYFLREKVDQKRIESVINNFQEDASCYSLRNWWDKKDYSNDGFTLRKNKTPYLNSCQIKIHNKDKLLETLNKDMTPWEWETTIIDSPYKFYENRADNIFYYGYKDYKWFGIRKGKWCREVVSFFEKENINMDYSKRGFYD